MLNYIYEGDSMFGTQKQINRLHEKVKALQAQVDTRIDQCRRNNTNIQALDQKLSSLGGKEVYLNPNSIFPKKIGLQARLQTLEDTLQALLEHFGLERIETPVQEPKITVQKTKRS